MRFIDYVLMALRNLRRQRLRTALTIFAIVIGATSITIMLTAVFSLRGFINSQFEQNGTFQQVAVSPQADITWRDQNQGGNNCTSCVKLTDDLAAQIAKVRHVTGLARVADSNPFQYLQYNGQKLRLNQVTAYDTNGVLQNNVLAGRDINADDTSGVLTITSDYADKLGYKGKYQQLIGQQVSLISQPWYNGVGYDALAGWRAQSAFFSSHPGVSGQDYTPAPTTLTGRIVGVVDTMRDNYTIRVPLTWARQMDESQNVQVTPAAQDAANAACRNRPGPCNVQPQPTVIVEDELAKQGYTSFIVKVDQSSNAAGVARQIKSQFKVGAADAQTEIKQQLAVFNILGLVLGGIGGIALVVASVGVVNTMIMSILERTREIGVMRAVGARRATVSRLFTIEAALLGFWGGVFGLALGYAATLVANPIINKQLSSNGIKSTNIIALPLWLIIGVVALTTVIGILAGLYPARRAARLDPVEALHYE